MILPEDWREKAADQVEEGGLARAVRSDHRAQLARLDRHRHVVDGDQAAEMLRDVLHRQQTHVVAFPPNAIRLMSHNGRRMQRAKRLEIGLGRRGDPSWFSVICPRRGARNLKIDPIRSGVGRAPASGETKSRSPSCLSSPNPSSFASASPTSKSMSMPKFLRSHPRCRPRVRPRSRRPRYAGNDRREMPPCIPDPRPRR